MGNLEGAGGEADSSPSWVQHTRLSCHPACAPAPSLRRPRMPHSLPTLTHLPLTLFVLQPSRLYQTTSMLSGFTE